MIHLKCSWSFNILMKILPKCIYVYVLFSPASQWTANDQTHDQLGKSPINNTSANTVNTIASGSMKFTWRSETSKTKEQSLKPENRRENYNEPHELNSTFGLNCAVNSSYPGKSHRSSGGDIPTRTRYVFTDAVISAFALSQV